MPLVQHTKIERRARLVRKSLLPLVIAQPTMTTSGNMVSVNRHFARLGQEGKGHPRLGFRERCRSRPVSLCTVLYAHRTVTAAARRQRHSKRRPPLKAKAPCADKDEKVGTEGTKLYFSMGGGPIILVLTNHHKWSRFSATEG